jgi:hypothetical protein
MLHAVLEEAEGSAVEIKQNTYPITLLVHACTVVAKFVSTVECAEFVNKPGACRKVYGER